MTATHAIATPRDDNSWLIGILIIAALMLWGEPAHAQFDDPRPREDSIRADEAIALPEAEPVAADDFSGTFQADVNGEESVAELTQTGTRVHGEVDGLRISGTAKGRSAAVQLIDPSRNVVVAVARLQRRGENIIATLITRDQRTGELVRIAPITYSPGAAGAADTKEAQPKGDPSKIDQQLVGSWSRMSSSNSINGSAGIQWSMTLDADGTYSKSSYSSVSAGGGDLSGENGERGTWRAENGRLYLTPRGGEELYWDYRVFEGAIKLNGTTWFRG
jgi:hypothetical protein